MSILKCCQSKRISATKVNNCTKKLKNFYLFVNKSVRIVSQLKEVVLKSGKVLRADVCVIGAGDVDPFPILPLPPILFPHDYHWLVPKDGTEVVTRLFCRERSRNRLPEAKWRPHGLERLHHSQQGGWESPRGRLFCKNVRTVGEWHWSDLPFVWPVCLTKSSPVLLPQIKKVVSSIPDWEFFWVWSLHVLFFCDNDSCINNNEWDLKLTFFFLQISHYCPTPNYSYRYQQKSIWLHNITYSMATFHCM